MRFLWNVSDGILEKDSIISSSYNGGAVSVSSSNEKRSNSSSGSQFESTWENASLKEFVRIEIWV